MLNNSSGRTSPRVVMNGAQRVLVATTAMLAFISFWRAAAVVLNDMGSSAFYAGAISEHFVGKTAPWFILAIMLLSYAVRAVYIESCSMFVRGGVYRVVKEAMGGTLAKFSVSALMFDYILTGPISGVSAGLYLVGLLNELLRHAHSSFMLNVNWTAALFAGAVTVYFWWQNIKGIPESSEKALRIMYVTTVMVVMMIIWCVCTLWVRGAHLPPWPHLSNLVYSNDALGWLRHTSLPYTVGLIGVLIGLGHSVLAMSGEETMAQVYREIEHPKLKNLEKAGFVIFAYSLIFTAGVAFFAVMIIPDSVRNNFFDNPIGGLAMYLVGPLSVRLAFRAFVVVVGVLMLAGAVNTAIVGSNGTIGYVSNPNTFSNTCLPDAAYNYAMFPHWDDLRTDCAGCGIYTSLSGTTPSWSPLSMAAACRFTKTVRLTCWQASFRTGFSRLRPAPPSWKTQPLSSLPSAHPSMSTSIPPSVSSIARWPSCSTRFGRASCSSCAAQSSPA